MLLASVDKGVRPSWRAACGYQGMTGGPKVRNRKPERGCAAMKCKKDGDDCGDYGVLAVMGGWAIAAQDKYTVKVPNGARVF